ncbi:Xylose isomerase-like TIM barrel [Zobellia uliginosa]|uniref:Xylose isomerase-like TIM barrel n=1 Tax=Zobellia uliginosa TaxID=143224 RepID=A0ABY1L298_9FLAO|nr:TIM barrel protein [Zobellia uliginosa]SIT11485.1 Xylose isomerase-like TIM barrel [Zobellia uliginosa]
MKRRQFITNTVSAGVVSALSPTLLTASSMLTMKDPRRVNDDISLAQWALVDEFKSGKLNTLDFPRIAREGFDLNGIEFVNILFDVPTSRYINELKKNANDHGVEMVLMMVDQEGETAAETAKARKQTVDNHKKWIDIAQELGCHAVRTNCRGPEGADKDEALKWAADTYNMMLEYAIPANVSICIENHGGLSNDTDWMLALMKEVDNLYFGSYPDWREPSESFDNYNFLKQMLPYAKGMSFRNQPTEEIAIKMINLCKESGYRGYYGIESKGRKEIKQAIKTLRKHLLNE